MKQKKDIPIPPLDIIQEAYVYAQLEKTHDFVVMPMTEDFFMPVRGGDSGTQIETLPGLGNDGAIEDVEYLKNNL